MAVYLLVYDITSSAKDYDVMLKKLSRLNAVKVQRSAWLLELNQDIIAFRSALKTDLDADDKAFIVEITPGQTWAGLNMMPPSAEWLLQRRP